MSSISILGYSNFSFEVTIPDARGVLRPAIYSMHPQTITCSTRATGAEPLRKKIRCKKRVWRTCEHLTLLVVLVGCNSAATRKSVPSSCTRYLAALSPGEKSHSGTCIVVDHGHQCDATLAKEGGDDSSRNSSDSGQVRKAVERQATARDRKRGQKPHSHRWLPRCGWPPPHHYHRTTKK